MEMYYFEIYKLSSTFVTALQIKYDKYWRGLPMIRVLLVEDNPKDLSRIRDSLTNVSRNPYLESFEFLEAESLAKGMHHLQSGGIDVVLLDLGLPDAREFEGIDRIKTTFPSVPIIVLTHQQEDLLVSIEALKRGAQDYYCKDQVNESQMLDRIIRY